MRLSLTNCFLRSITKKRYSCRDGGKGNDTFCDWDIGLMKVMSFEVDVMSVCDCVLNYFCE